MTSENEIHVVLGASGGTGNAVARALAEEGRRVRAVNRKGDAHLPAEIERVAADVTKTEDARRAVEGATVVYHCAQPEYTRWTEDFPPMNRAVLEATAAVDAKLVFADNLYTYGPVDGPMTEDSPPYATGKKGTVREQMAQELLAAHRDGRLRVAIGRASDYFGPRGLDSSIGDRLFEAAIKGKKVPWLGSLDQPHTVSFTEDMGRAYATLGEHAEADGQVWHLPAAEPITGRAFVEMVGHALGHPVRPTATTAGMVRLAGLFVPMIREVGETMYQWTQPFIADWSKFERAFGPAQVTPLDEAIRRTVAWFQERVQHAAA
jgi:nucleoside-diphosphate-sugar epimerase